MNPLRRMAFAFGLVFCAGTGYMLWRYCAPIVEMEKQIIVRQVQAGERRTVSVPIKNSGRRTLVLKRFASSCSCTEVKADRLRIPPGESARLALTVTGDSNGAEKAAWLLIDTNDPTNSVFVAQITVLPARSYVIAPAVIDFGNLDPHDGFASVSKRITITGESLDFIQRIQHIDARVMELPIVSVRRTVLSPASIAFDAVINTTEHRGELSADVELHDKHNEFREVVPLYAYIPSKLFLRPAPLVLDVGKLQSGDVFDIVLPLRDGIRGPLSVECSLIGAASSLFKVESCVEVERGVRVQVSRLPALARDELSGLGRWGYCGLLVKTPDGVNEYFVISVRLKWG